MDKLTSIKAFTRVVQHGSFAAAARELRLSRSAVSKYVIDLEQAYHIKTAPVSIVGAAKTIRGLYFDPVRKYLFVLAAQADDSRGAWEALVHVFAIRD